MANLLPNSKTSKCLTVWRLSHFPYRVITSLKLILSFTARLLPQKWAHLGMFALNIPIVLNLMCIEKSKHPLLVLPSNRPFFWWPLPTSHEFSMCHFCSTQWGVEIKSWLRSTNYLNNIMINIIFNISFFFFIYFLKITENPYQNLSNCNSILRLGLID